MKRNDWVIASLKAIGIDAEKSATGGYWISYDWDYESEGTWNLVTRDYAIRLFGESV